MTAAKEEPWTRRIRPLGQIRELVLVAGANASHDLLELAERADVLD
ncbi:hypothetical protein [Streptomyces sp. NPDC058612]